MPRATTRGRQDAKNAKEVNIINDENGNQIDGVTVAIRNQKASLIF